MKPNHSSEYQWEKRKEKSHPQKINQNIYIINKQKNYIRIYLVKLDGSFPLRKRSRALLEAMKKKP